VPTTNMVIAIALIICITLRLKLLGRLSSFLRKKYINKSNKKKGFGLSEAFFKGLIIANYFCLNSTRRFITRPSSVELSAIGLVSPMPLTLILLASTPELTK